MAQVSPCVSFHIIHACALVSGVFECFSSHPSLYFFLQFLFQLYLMSIPAPDEISMEDPLCDSSLGSMVTLDYVTPLTACEDLSWNHCTSTPHRSETNGIAERAVRRVKEGTSAVLLQSGLNESWWADSMGILHLSAKRHRSII